MKIEVKNVSKRFNKNVVLENVNMTLESGHIYGFMGRNGSGKSVLLKLLCGFYVPSEGEIFYNQKDFNATNEFPPNTRALIEHPNFFPDLTGFENLKLLADIQKIITEDEIQKAIEIVHLNDEKNKKYSTYSLGTKQKLGIAQAIMEPSEILILDEPFNGIEESTVKEIMQYLKMLKQQEKLIIISSHMKDDLMELSDVVYHFDAGKVELVSND